VLTAHTLRRRLNLEVLLRVAAAPTWMAAAAFAGWRLLVGAFVPASAVVAVAAAGLAVVLRFRRAAWSASQSLVAVDRLADAGGLALALAEASGPQWEPVLASRLASARPPLLSLARPALAILLALGFAVTSALVPRPVRQVPPIQAAAESHVDAAELKAEALKAEEPLDAALLAELERLKQEAESGRFDSADWAALDAVNEALDQAAAQRNNDLAQAEAAAQKLAQALDAKADDEAEQRAKEQLEIALMKLDQGVASSGQPTESGAASNPAAAEAKPGTKPKTGADAKQLAQALAKRREALEKAEGSGLSKYQKGSLACAEGEGQGSGYSHDHSYADGTGEPGSGAPTRGPGAAPVTFGPQHPIDPDELKAEALAKDKRERTPDELEGMRAVAPKPGDPASKGTLGAPAAGPDGLVPGAAPLAPRHRDLVKRYFDRKPGEKR
jgi:hypothetical protein